VRACVLWEGNFAIHSVQNTGGTPKEKDNEVKVKMEAMDIDSDDLFDGELCSRLLRRLADFTKLTDSVAPAPETLARNVNPQLLHILHPYALDNLIGALSHLNTFRAYLDTLQASAVKAGIAKDVIVDVIDCSGIDFKELELGLKKVKTELAAVDGAYPRCEC
jgi:hypothetical protein